MNDDHKIHNETQRQAANERIAFLQQILVETRRTHSASNYVALSQAYLAEIDQMQAEVREYLARTDIVEEAA